MFANGQILAAPAGGWGALPKCLVQTVAASQFCLGVASGPFRLVSSTPQPQPGFPNEAKPESPRVGVSRQAFLPIRTALSLWDAPRHAPAKKLKKTAPYNFRRGPSMSLWWTVQDLNLRHLPCKGSALPAELTVQILNENSLPADAPAVKGPCPALLARRRPARAQAMGPRRRRQGQSLS